MHDESSEPYSPAERIYGSWRLRLDAGDAAESFDALCASHPELADELQALHALAAELKGLAQAAELGTSAEERSTRDEAAQALRELARHGAVGGRYEIGREIGRGGMGSVHEARDLLLERVVACKRIADPAATARLLPLFRREMRIAARLSHAAVAGIHDAGVDAEGRAYFTMPLIRGRNLSEVYRMVARGADGWSVVRAVAILLQVSEAMAYVHAQGVVHRDLKPGNIRVGEYGEVHVMDWGIAKLAGDPMADDGSPRAKLAEASGGAGTPPYMSPEQWRSGGVAGPSSDVHALGVMLYELLAGHPPYHGEGEGRVATDVLWKRIQAGPPTPIHAIAREQPAELCSICERAMRREPDQRYPDCSALAADLRAFLEGRVVAAHESGAWAETKKWVRRNKPLAAALAATVVASVGGAVAFQSKAVEAERNAKAAELERDRANDQTRRAQDLAVEAAAQARKAEERGAALAIQITEVELRTLGDEAQRLRRALNDRGNPLKASAWMAAARRAVEGGVDSDGRRIPGLADVRARLAALRDAGRYLPLAEDDRLRDELNHPAQAELARLVGRREEVEATMRGEINQLEKRAEWQARMLGAKSWPNKEGYARNGDVQATLEERPPEHLARESLLYTRSHARRLHGMEMRGLVYAEHAVAHATSEHQPEARRALAWALWATGKPEAARVELEAARDAAAPEAKSSHAEDLLLMAAEQARFAGAERTTREQEVQDWKAQARQRWKGFDADVAAKTAEIDRRIVEVRERTKERRTWRFRDTADELVHARLVEAEARLVALQSLLAAHDDPEHARRWEEAVAGVASSPRYAGTKWPGGAFARQIGLVPLGPDPRSGLWEFLHVESGAQPVRDAEGCIQPTPEAGVVFVLVPGGAMPRVQPPKEARYSQEEWAIGFELAPYFLAKHELTRAQWERLSGDASRRTPSDQALLPSMLPSWRDYDERLLPRLCGVSFPSRLQWEYAMRAGTTTLWWTGDAESSLVGFETLRFGDKPGDLLPIGALPPNPWGFHDIVGNMAEMCGDVGADIEDELLTEWVQLVPPLPGDGLKSIALDTYRLSLGGAYWMRPRAALVEMELDPGERESGSGLRLAMRVLP